MDLDWTGSFQLDTFHTLVATWMEGHTRGIVARWHSYSQARPHPGDVHFGPIKPIFFKPWLRNGPIGPKGSYPNQTKKVENY